MQSRASVLPLVQGDLAVFAVNHRPVRGMRGDYRVAMRHGVSTLRSGERFTLVSSFTTRRRGSGGALNAALTKP